ncbi:major capsid protein [Shewanella algae]|uniref:major capsid protein n=1 Tax=Shewanella algae TaxID=38313 RepID=UPI001AADAA8B|nr:major capsid protein [Shewanella algae]MBO2656200.1 major capsid protein [Shewanella algae]
MPKQARFEDPVLSRVALGYRPANLVGLELFPRVEVAKTSGKVLTFGKEAFKLIDTRRAPGSAIKSVMNGAGVEPIALYQDNLNGKVPREWLREAADLPSLNHQTRAVNHVMNQFALQLEVQQSQLARTVGNYGTNNHTTLTGTDKWTAEESSPKADIDAGREAIRSAIGLYPNKVTFSALAWTAFKNHPETKEHFKYSGAKSVTTEMAAEYLEVKKVVVGEAVVATANTEDPELEDIWGKDVILAYVPSEAESFIEVPSFGYTYELVGSPLVEEGWFDKGCNSWLYPTEVNRRAYITGMDAGFLIKGAV